MVQKKLFYSNNEAISNIIDTHQLFNNSITWELLTSFGLYFCGKINPISHKILIVDDNEELCSNLADILELIGCEVKIVHDGYSAIEALKKDKFDVVLLDVKMPGISGIDTLKIIKKISPEINVIMITAFANDVFYKEGLKDIEFEVFQKPIDIDKLLDKIGKIFH